MTRHRLGLILDLILLLCLCILPPSDHSPKRTIWDEITQPYVFSISGWEFDRLLDKWGYKLEQFFIPNRLSDNEKAKRVKEYLSLANDVSSLEDFINHEKSTGISSEADIRSLEARLVQLKRQRDSLEDQVEEIIEGHISRILADEGVAKTIELMWGIDFLFPPVDFEFEVEPNVLIISPRDKIVLAKTILLRGNLSPEQIVDIEGKVENMGMSALVERTGGVATYPSIVPQTLSLEDLLISVAHEWVHQYFFFHPLGRNYWKNYEMTTINETAADIAGDEIGQLAYYYYFVEADDEAMPPLVESAPVFDFNKEMRETRLTVDRYLEEGQIDEAERFMEEKRDYLAQNGYYIRKLNQAYFAFHGTYAASPSSVDPIGGYLKEMRLQSDSLGDFIKTVSGISSYDELLKSIDK